MLASTPNTAGVTTAPAPNTTSPLRTSSPVDLTDVPAVTAAVSRTLSRSRRSDSSTITTASAPGGIGAPVMIRIVWPLASGVAGGGAPAGSSPTTVSSTGGDAVSVAITA